MGILKRQKGINIISTIPILSDAIRIGGTESFNANFVIGKALPYAIAINSKIMTKADIVSNISDQLGIDRADVQATVEKFMKEVKGSLEKGENVYLRGFGSFIIKTRAEKTGRNISKNIALKIPAHNIPSFKPAKIFVKGVKSKVPVSK